MIPKWATSWGHLFGLKGRKKKADNRSLMDRLVSKVTYEMDLMGAALEAALPSKPEPGLDEVVDIGMKRKPRKYQILGVRKMERFRRQSPTGGTRTLLGDSMGLGKTMQSLMYAVNHPELRPMVVVCPASIKVNWQRECSMMGIMAVVLEGTKARRSVTYQADCLIINYDILQSWLEVLRQVGPRLVIIDECQYTGSPHSQRTRAVRELCADMTVTTDVIATSGTAFNSRPFQLFPILNLLRPDKFPSAFDFGEEFCKPEKGFGKWKFPGAQKLHVLHHRMKRTCYIRRRIEDVIRDLPEKVRSVIPLHLSEPDRKQYSLAHNHFTDWMAGYNPWKASAQEQVQAMTQLGIITRLAAQLKMKQVVRWVDDFLKSGDDKLIVFGIQRAPVVDLLATKFPGCALVHGGTSTSKRQDEFDRFNDDKDCRLLVGNLEAAGVGWNCRSANNVAFVEFDYRPALHEQAGSRIYGVGRGIPGRPAFYHYLIAVDTVEERVVRKIQERQTDVLDVALDGSAGVTNLSIFTDLMKELKREV